MSMLLRYDPVSHCLRSVGDQPNGIVGLAEPDGAPCWMVDSSYDPARSRGAPLVPATPGVGVRLHAQVGGPGIGAGSTVVDVDDLVAALEGPAEAIGLLGIITATLQLVSVRYGSQLIFEQVGAYVVLALETRDAVWATGLLNPPGGPA